MNGDSRPQTSPMRVMPPKMTTPVMAAKIMPVIRGFSPAVAWMAPAMVLVSTTAEMIML